MMQDGTFLNIDYNSSNISELKMKRHFSDLMYALSILQTYSEIPADQFAISITLNVDGQMVNHLVINKEFYQNSQ